MMSDGDPTKPHAHDDADRSVRVTGHLPFRGYNAHLPVQRTRRRLPHWTQPGAAYFITFRLADSIPANLWMQWEQEREVWLRLNPQPWSSEVEAEYEKRFRRRLEEWLDRGFGEWHLRRPDVRAIAKKHFLHFHGERYDLDAFVLMPNHVHALLVPRNGHELFDLMQGIKGTSARACNKLLERTGTTFWMEDNFNRLVRNAEELFAYRRYIAGNPVKAKLRDDEFALVLNDVLYVEP